jgi:hypothetical protein
VGFHLARESPPWFFFKETWEKLFSYQKVTRLPNVQVRGRRYENGYDSILSHSRLVLNKLAPQPDIELLNRDMWLLINQKRMHDAVISML